METAKTTLEQRGGQRWYRYADESGGKLYPAADVIDVPFALKPDRMAVYSPIDKCRNAIGLAIAMETYASNFFQGGGVPPLAVTGPLPKGPEALKRAMGDIGRAIDAARSSSKPIFAMPPDHELKPVGFDPEKGQRGRSEEHTSELQSLMRNPYAVFCL